MLDLTIVNRGKPVTTLDLVNAMMTNEKVIDVTFDGQVTLEEQVALMSSLYEAQINLAKAMHPLLKHSQFPVVIIGAEIDEDAEALWLWLDDPENPL